MMLGLGEVMSHAPLFKTPGAHVALVGVVDFCARAGSQ